MGEVLCIKLNGEDFMKKTVIPFLLLMASAVMLAAVEETFVIKSHEFRVSIEHHGQRDGWTPLVLISAGLDIRLVMDGSGRVLSDKAHAGIGSTRPVCVIDPESKMVVIGTESIPVAIEEQNAGRTRLRLLRHDIPLLLKLDMEKESAEIQFAETRFWLAVNVQETSPGVSLIRLISPNIQVMGDLYLLSSDGGIHQANPGDKSPEPGKRPAWAQRLIQGEER